MAKKNKPSKKYILTEEEKQVLKAIYQKVAEKAWEMGTMDPAVIDSHFYNCIASIFKN